MNWTVLYDNDTDDGFLEWWEVTDGKRSFRCYDEEDAKWLCDLLNKETS